MRVAFADLSRGLAAMRGDVDAAIARALDSGRFLLGPETEAFEREFAAAIGVDHAVGVASGTDAVELGLRAVGIEPGDEVITQANTCVPTVTASCGRAAPPSSAM